MAALRWDSPTYVCFFFGPADSLVAEATAGNLAHAPCSVWPRAPSACGERAASVTADQLREVVRVVRRTELLASVALSLLHKVRSRPIGERLTGTAFAIWCLTRHVGVLEGTGRRGCVRQLPESPDLVARLLEQAQTLAATDPERDICYELLLTRGSAGASRLRASLGGGELTGALTGVGVRWRRPLCQWAPTPYGSRTVKHCCCDWCTRSRHPARDRSSTVCKPKCTAISFASPRCSHRTQCITS